MATTHGYSGEFSSDDEVDKRELHSDQRGQAKSYATSKPSKAQIEESIRMLKTVSNPSSLVISDELLAAILDHYKTQRGPIVDSTRNLYKKIALRLAGGNVNEDDREKSSHIEHKMHTQSQDDSESRGSSDDDEPDPREQIFSDENEHLNGREKTSNSIDDVSDEIDNEDLTDKESSATHDETSNGEASEKEMDENEAIAPNQNDTNKSNNRPDKSPETNGSDSDVENTTAISTKSRKDIKIKRYTKRSKVSSSNLTEETNEPNSTELKKGIQLSKRLLLFISTIAVICMATFLYHYTQSDVKHSILF